MVTVEADADGVEARLAAGVLSETEVLLGPPSSTPRQSSPKASIMIKTLGGRENKATRTETGRQNKQRTPTGLGASSHSFLRGDHHLLSLGSWYS